MRSSCTALLLACVLLSAASPAGAAGLASSPNFIVQAPRQKLADAVLASAEQYRRDVARQWLGQTLDKAQGRTLIHVRIRQNERSGNLWPRGGSRQMHTLWLVGTAEEVTGSWLKRNIAQLVLETKHPGRISPYLREGIAASCDSPSLVRDRQQLLKWFHETHRWPELGKLLEDDYVDEADRAGLAAAASLTQMLLERSDEQTLVSFARAGKTDGWNAALSRYYQLENIDHLQSQWQLFVASSLEDAADLPQTFADVKYRRAEHDAATARSVNFTVYAQDRQMASDLLAEVEKLRTEIAIEWLGEPLPPGVGRTIVHVRLTDDQDRANTLIHDPARRVSHVLWVTTSPDKVYSSLAHEITHTVFATRFAQELPVWAHEGAASQRDDPRRRAWKESALREMGRSGRFVDLAALLGSRAIAHDDGEGYAVAASLTEFLTARGGNRKFLQFAVAGRRDGWDAALRKHYRIANVRDLQLQWQRWLGGSPAAGLR